MNVANSTEVHGLERFLRTLDKRKDPERRTRGLITGNPQMFIISRMTY